MKKFTCQRCGYKWLARVEVPKACPRCKRYDWSQTKAVFVKDEKDD